VEAKEGGGILKKDGKRLACPLPAQTSKSVKPIAYAFLPYVKAGETLLSLPEDRLPERIDTRAGLPLMLLLSSLW